MYNHFMLIGKIKNITVDTSGDGSLTLEVKREFKTKDGISLTDDYNIPISKNCIISCVDPTGNIGNIPLNIGQVIGVKGTLVPLNDESSRYKLNVLNIVSIIPKYDDC